MPAFTAVAPAHAVELCGARPVFCDIDPFTLTIDPAAAEAAVTPRTRGLLAVHQFGLPADLDALGTVARRHGLHLIEDAACAAGAAYRGRPVGADRADDLDAVGKAYLRPRTRYYTEFSAIIQDQVPALGYTGGEHCALGSPGAGRELLSQPAGAAAA